MIYFENIRYDEIAESMNISANMVRSHRARGFEIAHPPYTWDFSTEKLTTGIPV
jgi:hypothetical protein